MGGQGQVGGTVGEQGQVGGTVGEQGDGGQVAKDRLVGHGR